MEESTTVLISILVTTVSIPTLVCYVLIGTQHERGVRSFTPGEEAQEIAEAVLDAETKLGELTSRMEQTKGARTDIKPMDNGVLKSKAQQLEEIGITEKQKQRFETLARHPEVVEQAKSVLIPR